MRNRIFYSLAVMAIFTFAVANYALATSSDYTPSSGSDAVGTTIKTLTATNITALSTSNNALYVNGSWPRNVSSYNEAKYLQFNFTPNLPPNVIIASTTVTYEYRRSNTLTGAKLEVWNGSSWQNEVLTIPSTTNTDLTQIKDISSYINTPAKVNSLKIRFLAYRSDNGNTTTSHDLVKITVNYIKATPTVSIINSTFTYDGLAKSVTATSSVPGIISNIRYNSSLTAPTSSGTYTVTANFVPTDTASYNSLTGVTIGSLVINPASQTINFSTVADKTYGDTDFSLVATSSSGLPVSFSASGDCTVTGGIVHLVRAGTCSIIASQIGNGNWSLAPDQTQTFNILPKSVTVTADSQSKEFSDIDPSLTYQITTGELVSPDVFTGDLIRDAGETVGTYAIKQNTLSLSDNYNLTFIEGVLEIMDTTAPVITAPIDLSSTEAASSTGSVITFSATALDAVDGPVPVSCDPSTNTVFALGTTMVTCQATDAHENTAVSTFNVIVSDTNAPTLMLPEEIIAEATSTMGASVTFTAEASDLVDGSTAVLCNPASDSVFALGTTTVSCEASDKVGNIASSSFNVIIRDTTAPIIEALPNIIIEAASSTGTAVSFPVATSTDVVDSEVAVTCDGASGTTFSIGETTVLCTATDDYNNFATTSFKIKVQDTISPIITLIGSSTIDLFVGDSYTDAGVTASDNIDGDITARVTATSTISTTTAGVYSVTYFVSDSAGNATTSMRTVNIATKPVPPVVSGGGGGGSVRKIVKKVILNDINTSLNNPLQTIVNYFDNSEIVPVELVDVPVELTTPTVTTNEEVIDPDELVSSPSQFVPVPMTGDFSASSTAEIQALYSAAISSANMHTFGSWWTGLFAIIDAILIAIYFKKKKI